MFGCKVFSTENFSFGRQFFRPKTFLADLFLGRKKFSAENFFDRKSFRPKTFSDEKFFDRKFRHPYRRRRKRWEGSGTPGGRDPPPPVRPSVRTSVLGPPSLGSPYGSIQLFSLRRPEQIQQPLRRNTLPIKHAPQEGRRYVRSTKEFVKRMSEAAN